MLVHPSPGPGTGKKKAQQKRTTIPITRRSQVSKTINAEIVHVGMLRKKYYHSFIYNFLQKGRKVWGAKQVPPPTNII